MVAALNKILIFALLPLLILFIGAFFYTLPASSAQTSLVQATITITVCGNNVKETGEECDGTDLAGLSCSNFSGFTGGTLSCRPSCEFNTSLCTSAATPSGGGGGGGGGSPTPAITSVVFVGRAYPERTVTLLKDGQVAVKSIAGPDANFEMALTGLSAGDYIFSLYSNDKNGLKSALFTFPVTITQGATTRVSGIFLAPTIGIDKSELKRGDNLVIFGQSVPKSEITINVNSEEEHFLKTKADKNGVYLYNFDTSILEKGKHSTKSKSALSGEVSAFSEAVGFTIGDKSVIKEPPSKRIRADLNRDDKVNLIDFSIAAYWYKRSAPPSDYDLNNDGKIDLVDFSIMAYHWTG